MALVFRACAASFFEGQFLGRGLAYWIKCATQYEDETE